MSVPDPKVPAYAPPPYTQYPVQGAPPPAGFQYPPQVPPGYAPYPAPPPGTVPAPGYGSTNIVIPPPAPEIVIIGGCPACRAGVLEDEYSCLGLVCAIVFFPVGLLCCLAMRERRCTNCRAVF